MSKLKSMACNIFLNLTNGRKMPGLGLGTWQSNDDSLQKALDVALDIGYRHIDTASAYQNEDTIGNVLRKHFHTGKLKREDIFVTTKLAATCLYPEKVEESLANSLKRLQLDYVDLYLIHFPITVVIDGVESYGHPNIHFTDVWKKMEEQQDNGRAKAIGISNFNQRQVEHLLRHSRIKPANNQVELHTYLQQTELVNFCRKNGVTVTAYSPLGSRGYNLFLEKFGLPTKEIPDLLADKIVADIAKKQSRTPAQVILRYLIQLGVAPIPKSVSPNRLKENFEVFDFNLDEADMTSLRALDLGSKGRICGWEHRKVAEHPEFPF